jgi:hypothetical protein
MKHETKRRFRRGRRSWIAVALFWTVGLLEMAQPLHAADGSESWWQSIRSENKESLVFISVTARANGNEDYFAGTGFIVHPAGYVLTCYHVIFGESRFDYLKVEDTESGICQVSFAGESDRTNIEIKGSVGGRYRSSYPLWIIDRNYASDLILLKLPEESWRSLTSSAEAKEASEIVAVGFPEYVGKLHPALGSITGSDDKSGRWITNADFNHGMSGGPVFNRQGAVIGIVEGGYPTSNKVCVFTPIHWATGLLQLINSPLLNPSPSPSPPQKHRETERPTLIPPDLPKGIPTGRSGFVISPYRPQGAWIDVRDKNSGDRVQDPSTYQWFIIP